MLVRPQASVYDSPGPAVMVAFIKSAVVIVAVVDVVIDIGVVVVAILVVSIGVERM
jgi:hypothetical protein